MQLFLRNTLEWLRDNQTFAGCFVIGCGTLLLALSGILKTKAEKGGGERKKDDSERRRARSRARNNWIAYGLSLLLGVALNILGTWLTKQAGDEASRKRSQETERMLHAQREQDERTVRELREERQSILVALNAAKREDSKKITEEKIHVIQSDFSQWAEKFATNLPGKRNEFAQLKADFQKAQIDAANKEIQRQIQISGQEYPVFSFGIRFLQESVRAYAKQTGRGIQVDPLELGENFFVKSPDREIRFGTNAVWRISVISNTGGQMPYLKVTFIDSLGGQSGMFQLRFLADNKLRFNYAAKVPIPNPATVNGLHDMINYEGAVRDALQRVIEAQLLQVEEKH